MTDSRRTTGRHEGGVEALKGGAIALRTRGLFRAALGRSFAWIAVLALLAGLLGSACLSPTLPLPPPDVSSMHPSATGEGVWAITGNCDPGALITVFNERSGKGAVIEDRELSGHFTILIDAELCDAAWVKQEIGTETSLRSTFTIEDMTSFSPTEPAACP